MVSVRDRLPAPFIAKFYVYEATTTFGFYTPIFTLFLLHRDLTYTGIALLSTEYTLLTVFGEIPTGYLGDRIGRRDSLLVSAVAMTCSIAGFVVADSLPEFALLYGLWAVALVFRSGTDDAWLYETLRERLGHEEQFTTVRGRAESVGQTVTVAALLVGSALYAVEPVFPFVAATGLHALGIPLVLSMPRTAAFDGDGEREGSSVSAVAHVTRERLTAPGVRSLVAYAALFFALVSVVNTYVQPIARNTLGVPEPLLGPLYAGFTLAAAVASYYAGPLASWLGPRRAVVVVSPVVALLVAFATAVPALLLPAFFCYRGLNVALRSVMAGYLNDESGDAGRATTLSAASMAYAVVRLPLVLAIGVVADAYGPLLAVGAVAVVCLVGMGVVVGARVGFGATRTTA